MVENFLLETPIRWCRCRHHVSCKVVMCRCHVQVSFAGVQRIQKVQKLQKVQIIHKIKKVQKTQKVKKVKNRLE